jgi:hypothetical protein
MTAAAGGATGAAAGRLEASAAAPVGWVGAEGVGEVASAATVAAASAGSWGSGWEAVAAAKRWGRSARHPGQPGAAQLACSARRSGTSRAPVQSGPPRLHRQVPAVRPAAPLSRSPRRSPRGQGRSAGPGRWPPGSSRGCQLQQYEVRAGPACIVSASAGPGGGTYTQSPGGSRSPASARHTAGRSAPAGTWPALRTGARRRWPPRSRRPRRRRPAAASRLAGRLQGVPGRRPGRTPRSRGPSPSCRSSPARRACDCRAMHGASSRLQASSRGDAAALLRERPPRLVPACRHLRLAPWVWPVACWALRLARRCCCKAGVAGPQGRRAGRPTCRPCHLRRR